MACCLMARSQYLNQCWLVIRDVSWHSQKGNFTKIFTIPTLDMSVNISTWTHWGQVTHICIGKLTIIGSDNSLSRWMAPSHYLNQCWNFVNWTLENKLQWNFNRNSNIFIQENTFENVVWKMAAILSRLQCVKTAGIRLFHISRNTQGPYVFLIWVIVFLIK